MKILKKYALITTLLMIGFSSCGGDKEPVPNKKPTNPPTPGETVVYHQRAKELFDLISVHYKIKTGQATGLYNESYPKQSGDPSVSYLWPYDGLVSGMATLHELGYNVDYESHVNRFDAYWRTTGVVAVGGFGSSTDGINGGGTRFYDDNSIVGLDYVEAYKLTQNNDFRVKAKSIVPFLLSGEDDLLGGGLWWNESQKNLPGVGDSNKPGCSNGYATNFLLHYYSICEASERTEVLNFAKRLYTWVKANLRDPSDKCYWNDVNANGTINKVKWTYNSGVMISNGILLHKITGEQSYLDDAMATAEGSYNYFVKPRNGIPLTYPDHDPWFTTKLVKAYIEIEPYYPQAKNYTKTFISFLDNAYNKARNTTGFYYEDWTGTQPKRIESLLMQAAALESLGMIALYKGEKKE